MRFNMKTDEFNEWSPKHFRIIRINMILSVLYGPVQYMYGPLVYEKTQNETLCIKKCIRKGNENNLLPLNFWTIAFVSCFTDDRLLVFAPSLSRIETWLLLIDRRYSEIENLDDQRQSKFRTVKKYPFFGKLYIGLRVLDLSSSILFDLVNLGDHIVLHSLVTWYKSTRITWSRWTISPDLNRSRSELEMSNISNMIHLRSKL